jgi:hypothetical protein
MHIFSLFVIVSFTVESHVVKIVKQKRYANKSENLSKKWNSHTDNINTENHLQNWTHRERNVAIFSYHFVHF